MERTEIERRIVEGVLRHFPDCKIQKHFISEFSPNFDFLLKDCKGVLKEMKDDAETWEKLIDKIENNEIRQIY